MKELTTKERESLEYIIEHYGDCDLILCTNCIFTCNGNGECDFDLRVAKQKLKECDDMSKNIYEELDKLKRRIVELESNKEKEQSKEVPFHVGGVYDDGGRKLVLIKWCLHYYTVLDKNNNLAHVKLGISELMNKNEALELFKVNGFEYKGQLSDIIADKLK